MRAEEDLRTQIQACKYRYIYIYIFFVFLFFGELVTQKGQNGYSKINVLSQFPLNAILTRNVRFHIRLHPLPFMDRFDAAFCFGNKCQCGSRF